MPIMHLGSWKICAVVVYASYINLYLEVFVISTREFVVYSHTGSAGLDYLVPD